jgi:glycopeptide antibiotics resistance protein
MRRFVQVALVTTILGMGAIAFWPTPVDAPAEGTIYDILSQLYAAGLPRHVSYASIEVAANVLFFLPFGALTAALLSPGKWWVAGLLGGATSGAIELIQLTFLPQRFASVVDIAANFSGAFLGALVIVVARVVRSSRESNRRTTSWQP